MTPKELGQKPVQATQHQEGITLQQHLTIEAYRSGKCPFEGDPVLIAKWCVRQADEFLNSLAAGS